MVCVVDALSLVQRVGTVVSCDNGAEIESRLCESTLPEALASLSRAAVDDGVIHQKVLLLLRS